MMRTQALDEHLLGQAAPAIDERTRDILEYITDVNDTPFLNRIIHFL